MSRCLFACALMFTVATACFAAEPFKVQKKDGQITVSIGDDLFTNYIFAGHSKPIMYPILGPGGVEMTRNYPMKKDVPGEASDHPHQKSLWYTHGNVNGVDFWSEYERGTDKPSDKFGKIVQKEIIEARGGQTGLIKTRNEWVAPDKKTLLTDVRTITFHQLPGGRAIDFEITLTASHGDVTFGETKEGTMGIRTHPRLRLKGDEKKGIVANGKAVNSEGVEGKDVWGKRAKWVDYWGEIDGKKVGIAIFDHPSNPRHPTSWHARDYGLVAANPFGGHDFDKAAPEGSGDMTLKNGDSVTFKYRFYFHEGDHDAAKIPQAYQQWTRQSAE